MIPKALITKQSTAVERKESTTRKLANAFDTWHLLSHIGEPGKVTLQLPCFLPKFTLEHSGAALHKYTKIKKKRLMKISDSAAKRSVFPFLPKLLLCSTSYVEKATKTR